MTDLSPRLDLPFLMPSQAQKHVTHNEALLRLDTLVQTVLASFGEPTPPALPDIGSVHVPGADASGAWAGQSLTLAVWDGAAWQFLLPQEGWQAWDLGLGRMRVWTGVDWAISEPDSAETFGISTGADAVNRLAVAAPASLFTHSGGGHQLKVNKAALEDTASLLFQSNWTGHAEMGLAGDSAFSIKISSDGTAWHDALRADPVTQEIAFAPSGPVQARLTDAAFAIDVPLSGDAVQGSVVDATAGRVMTVGAFGIGATAVNVADLDEAPVGSLARFEVNDLNKPQIPGITNSAGICLTAEWNANSRTQLAHVTFPSALANTLWIRVYSGGIWSEWERVYSQSTVLGDVAMTAGQPTGAVFERADTPQGSYARHADGTQVCRASLTVTRTDPATLSAAWVYPKAFTSVDSICVTPDLTSVQGQTSLTPSQLAACGAEAVGMSGLTVALCRAVGQPDFATGDSATVWVTVSGRWD